MKRLNMISAYRRRIEVNGQEREYIVTIERLKNTASGGERFKAIIIAYNETDNGFFNAVYTFKGHYCGEQGEVDFILNRYLEECAD